MTENYKHCYLNILPTEIILIILKHLPARQIAKCRQICLRWKLIIDELATIDTDNNLWQKYCKEDFNSVYEIVQLKARPNISWFNIYRSLTLWPKLPKAREIQDEFALAINKNEEIKNFNILRNDVIGVHKKGEIIYYDTKSFEKTAIAIICGDYLKYSENENTIVLLNYHLQLFIVRKVSQIPIFEASVTLDNVKTFILIDKEVYYVTLNDEIYIYKLETNASTGTFIKEIEEGVMSLGYGRCSLNVLTLRRNIYSISSVSHTNIEDDQAFVFLGSLATNSNLIHQLLEYNLLEYLDWRIYTQWMYVLNHNIPESPISDIVTVRTYGDMVFIGTIAGVLSIYYAPNSVKNFIIDNAEPLKEYNFNEDTDCSSFSMCPIIQIDVLETIDGHMLLIGMPRKIVTIKFIYDY